MRKGALRAVQSIMLKKPDILYDFTTKEWTSENRMKVMGSLLTKFDKNYGLTSNLLKFFVP